MRTDTRIITTGIGSFMVLVLLGLWGCPQYKVWTREMDGRAELAQAEFNRRVQIEDAKGKLEAAKSLALAEAERAKGVAEANRIIGDSLQGNESYLRYLWIQGLQDGAGEVIYVPTEANLPLLEASRLKAQAKE